MRLANRLFTGLVIASTAGLLACGGGGDDDGGDGDGDIDPNGTHHRYVANAIKIPTSSNEASEFGLDIGGDTRKDNALGGLLATLAGLGLDVKTSVDSNIQSGGVIILADVQATDLTAATGVGLRVYLGADPSPEPCTDPEDLATCGKHLDGTGSFSVSADSPDDASLAGQIVGGRFTGGPGNVRLQLSLAEGSDPITLDLIGAKADVQVTADGLTSGKLGGAITDEQIRNDVLPAVVTIIGNLVEVDCTGSAGDCCEDSGSTGANLLSFLDTDEDCAVTQAELEGNSLISSTLLNPDLNMLNGTEYGPDIDDTNDSLSIGIGFEAVAATFEP